MDKPKIIADEVRELLHTRFVKVYELPYEDGTRYFDASRREQGGLLALKDEAELTRMLPDAISVCLVLDVAGDEPRIVLFYEYRYPTGQFVLSIPSGLIDARDRAEEDPLVAATVREIHEETGIELGPDDEVRVVSPFLFNTPGFTDESTALLCVVAHVDDTSMLSQEGAEGSERFDGFVLATRAQTEKILAEGRDPHGHFYPMVTWAAMTHFASGRWQK